MTVVGNVQRRNQLCLERTRIEAELMPECQNDTKLREYRARLLQIEYEIGLTYGEGEQESAG